MARVYDLICSPTNVSSDDELKLTARVGNGVDTIIFTIPDDNEVLFVNNDSKQISQSKVENQREVTVFVKLKGPKSVFYMTAHSESEPSHVENVVVHLI